MKATKHKCPGCGKDKVFRPDQKYCSKECAAPPKLELKETSEIKGDKWDIVLPKTRIHTLEQLLEFCEVDLSIWEVERFVCNKWEMNAGEGVVAPLYQVKAFLVKKKAVAFAKNEIEELKELAKKNATDPPKTRVPVGLGSGKMLLVNLTDQHFGKMSWGFETGWANLDMKINTAIWYRALSAILQRASNYDYEEIWFVVGNDLFNSDDVMGRTTAGTQVETDLRHEKTYKTVREILVNAIEELRTHAKKTKVLVIPGNHDHNATWHMGDSLECYFAKYPDVEVDNTPRPRKYHTFGTALLGFTHGDKGKRADLPMLMATEVPELFGKSKFREWYTGHNHVEVTHEKNGIVVRILSALCPPDAWHAENGYVGNRRSSQAFQWDKIEGLVGTVIYTDGDDKIGK